MAEITQIRTLLADGNSPEDIANGLGLEVSYVKMIAGQGCEMTDSEECEIKDILMDMARGRVSGQTSDNQERAAIYLHKQRRTEKMLKDKSGSDNREILVLLRAKAQERMREIEGVDITV